MPSGHGTRAAVEGCPRVRVEVPAAVSAPATMTRRGSDLTKLTFKCHYLVLFVSCLGFGVLILDESDGVHAQRTGWGKLLLTLCLYPSGQLLTTNLSANEMDSRHQDAQPSAGSGVVEASTRRAGPIDWLREQLATAPEEPAGTPCWRTGAFAGHFADAYLQNTNLEGGKVAPSIALLADIVTSVARGKHDECGGLPSSVREVLRSASRRMQTAARFAGAISQTERDPERFLACMNHVRRSILNLPANDFLVLDGGWKHKRGGHALFYIIERDCDIDASGPVGGEEGKGCCGVEPCECPRFTFSVCNSGEGLSFHEADMSAYPKVGTTTRAVWRSVLGRLALGVLPC